MSVPTKVPTVRCPENLCAASPCTKIGQMRNPSLDRSGMPLTRWAVISRVLAIMFICGLSAISQSGRTPPLLDVQKLMTVAEFRQTGLQKLSPEETDALNAWLSRFAMKVYGSASQATDAPPSAPAVVETQIEGEFEGWSGNTVFKLANGQIWQQASYAYTYHYAYRPNVLIYKAGAVYQMKVDGVDQPIQVKRLK